MACKYCVSDGYGSSTCALDHIDSRFWEDERIDCGSPYAWNYRFCYLQSWANSVGYDKSKKCEELTGFVGNWNPAGPPVSWKCLCSVHGKAVDPMREGCFGSFFKKCPSYTPPKDCFISTACVMARGLSDDCDELQTLRKYRDWLVVNRAGFAEIVSEYYQCAPRIVECIESEPNKSEIYEKLYVELVLTCVTMLNDHKIDCAIERYLSVYEELKQKYLN